MRYEKLPTGSVVFKQGDPGFSLYIIMAGAVRVVVSPPVGSHCNLRPLKSCGDFPLKRKRCARLHESSENKNRGKVCIRFNGRSAPITLMGVVRL